MREVLRKIWRPIAAVVIPFLFLPEAFALSLVVPDCSEQMDMSFSKADLGLLENHKNALASLADGTRNWNVSVIVVMSFLDANDANRIKAAEVAALRTDAIKRYLTHLGFEYNRIYLEQNVDRDKAKRYFSIELSGNIGIHVHGHAKDGNVYDKRCVMREK